MRATAPSDFGATLHAIPHGTTTGTAHGVRFTTTRSDFNQGRSTKLVAEALDGSDYISLNFYDLRQGGQLAPCEMPHEKAISFVMAYQPEVGVAT